MDEAQIQKVRSDVIDEMTLTRKMSTNVEGRAAIGDVFDRTLAKFFRNHADADAHWADKAFQGFIMSVVDNIADESIDVAYIRNNKPDEERPLVEAWEIKNVSKAVMVRRFAECAKYLKDCKAEAMGEICREFVESTEVVRPEAEAVITAT